MRIKTRAILVRLTEGSNENFPIIVCIIIHQKLGLYSMIRLSAETRKIGGEFSLTELRALRAYGLRRTDIPKTENREVFRVDWF